MDLKDINSTDYYYNLPDDRIAQYPVKERDMSQLLVCRGPEISKDTFLNIGDYLKPGTLLVFNNTRVIRARLLFRKETGAMIEILCLEPIAPKEYELSFGSEDPVYWKCIVGNLKKWKHGRIATTFHMNKQEYNLTAEKTGTEGETCMIKFSWDCPGASFAAVIEATGHIPLPPYIKREDIQEDIAAYQTVYSKINGSVAAPTAGLHFTARVLEKLRMKGIKTSEITLHVGAGTFQPIKVKNIRDHEMHCEHFFIDINTIESLLMNLKQIIAVGTTSVRTLESLYWLGLKLMDNKEFNRILTLDQWEAYNMKSNVSTKESLETLLKRMKEENISSLNASTSIMIVPGYQFRIIKGLITNFHQPNSTLLLLISAWIGEKWKEIYRYALENNFRFLSYGDSSLLIK